MNWSKSQISQLLIKALVTVSRLVNNPRQQSDLGKMVLLKDMDPNASPPTYYLCDLGQVT